MAKITLTDGSGRWFDSDRATRYPEETYWNGINCISRATRIPGAHEELWRTQEGTWIRHRWADYPGVLPSWEIISPDLAALWLAINGYHESPAERVRIEELEIL